MLDGLVNISTKICGLQIVHPFYYVDADIPAIGEYVTIADNPECRPQLRPRAQSLSVTEDTSPLPNTGEMTSTQTKLCGETTAKPQFSTASCSQSMNSSAPPFIPVEKDSGTATLDCDMPPLELPDHINLLYQTTVAQTRLSTDVDRQFKDMLHRRASTFASSSKDLSFCPLLLHDVDTGDAPPIKQSPRRPPLSAGNAEDEIIDEMLSTGVIEPSISEWASPVCLVKRPDGTYRFCIDYRRVNAVSRKDAFPIPDIQDALDSLRGARWFVTLDLLSGYWQLGLRAWFGLRLSAECLRLSSLSTPEPSSYSC